MNGTIKPRNNLKFRVESADELFLRSLYRYSKANMPQSFSTNLRGSYDAQYSAVLFNNFKFNHTSELIIHTHFYQTHKLSATHCEIISTHQFFGRWKQLDLAINNKICQNKCAPKQTSQPAGGHRVRFTAPNDIILSARRLFLLVIIERIVKNFSRFVCHSSMISFSFWLGG